MERLLVIVPRSCDRVNAGFVSELLHHWGHVIATSTIRDTQLYAVDDVDEVLRSKLSSFPVSIVDHSDQLTLNALMTIPGHISALVAMSVKPTFEALDFYTL